MFSALKERAAWHSRERRGACLRARFARTRGKANHYRAPWAKFICRCNTSNVFSALLKDFESRGEAKRMADLKLMVQTSAESLLLLSTAASESIGSYAQKDGYGIEIPHKP